MTSLLSYLTLVADLLEFLLTHYDGYPGWLEGPTAQHMLRDNERKTGFDPRKNWKQLGWREGEEEEGRVEGGNRQH